MVAEASSASWPLRSVAGAAVGLAPQDSDAKCGFACHTIVEKKDYVFTQYGTR